MKILLPREPAITFWSKNHFVDLSDSKLGRIARGYHFSLSNHSDKKRKSGQSYFYHDCDCANMARSAGLPPEMIVTMFAHEAIEDDEWTWEMLAEVFGIQVANSVAGVSKKPKPFFSRRIDRLNDHIVTMMMATMGMQKARKYEIGSLLSLAGIKADWPPELAVDLKTYQKWSNRPRQLTPNWYVAVLKGIDRHRNTGDTAGLKNAAKYRMFYETETHILPFLLWARPYIPKIYRPVYSVIINGIEGNCDNYWRSVAPH